MAEESVVHLNAYSVSTQETETQLFVQRGFSRDIARACFLCIRAAPAPVGRREDHIRLTQRDPWKDFRTPICIKRGQYAAAPRGVGFTNRHAYYMHQSMHKNKLDQPAFGVALQRARKRLGLSQSAVATKVGLEQSTVSRIEKGVVFQSSKSRELRAIIDDAAKLDDLEGIVADVARSPELRALVARILNGSMHP